MDIISLAIKVVGERYGLLGLPAVRSPRFLSLINGTKHLVNVTTVVEKSTRTAKSMRVSHEAGSMASTDLKLNVTVPAWYCYTESLEEFAGRKLTNNEATALSLALVNGSSIHEALHVAHSGKIMTKSFFKMIKEHEQSALYSYLINIVEDIRIESALRRSGVDELIAFVECKNEIFFQQDRLEKAIKEAEEKYEDDVKSAAVSTLVFYKNLSRRSFIDGYLKRAGFAEAAGILASIDHMSDTREVSDKLFEIFKSTEAGKSGSAEDLNMELAASEEAEQALEQYLEENPKAAEEFDEEDKIDEDIPDLQEIDIMDLRTSRNFRHATVDLKFGFMKKLKVVRQLLPSKSEPKTRGSKLLNHRLARIVTDGKIFSNHGDSLSSLQRKQPEFIILIDLSGSMGALAAVVTETVKNMSKAMREAGIPHAVYGHTSYGIGDTPTIYHIYSYKTNGRTDGNFEERFENVDRVSLEQNYDGLAIYRMEKKFNKRCEHKVLVNLSDGTPCAPRYHNEVEHTKTAIATLRRKSIKVLAMSLKDSVMSANDEIYGRDYNIDATSQSKLESSMQRIIMGG